MRNVRVSVWGDERGTTAVEFAIVAPVFFALVVGTLYLCLALFAVGSLHYAVEVGARCAAVKTAQCADAAATIDYTKQHYFGPSTTPQFTYATATCGNSVSGSTNYTLNFVLAKMTIPLTATACFP